MTAYRSITAAAALSLALAAPAFAQTVTNGTNLPATTSSTASPSMMGSSHSNV
jgi:hypothetical protein